MPKQNPASQPGFERWGNKKAVVADPADSFPAG
jgi:hypothetical protein